MPYSQKVLTVTELDSVEAHRDGDRFSAPVGKTTELSVWLAADAGPSARVDVLLQDPW